MAQAIVRYLVGFGNYINAFLIFIAYYLGTTENI